MLTAAVLGKGAFYYLTIGSLLVVLSLSAKTPSPIFRVSAAPSPKTITCHAFLATAGTRWYEYFLHNQRGRLLEWVLLTRGNERIFTVSAPWYVGAQT